MTGEQLQLEGTIDDRYYWPDRERCRDCRVDVCAIGEFDCIVGEGVWKHTGLGPHGGVLCVGCLEARIGRRLRAVDFSPCPLVFLPFGKSRRLWMRLLDVSDDGPEDLGRVALLAADRRTEDLPR